MSAAESWFAPAAVAQPVPVRQPSRRRPSEAPTTRTPKTQKRQRRDFKIRASLVWTVVLAVLLIGVVTLNVAVLRANVSVADLDAKITQLKGENATLASQLAGATAAPRVEDAAHRSGLVPASGTDTSYLDLVGRK
jgi:cell division protein FtsL